MAEATGFDYCSFASVNVPGESYCIESENRPRLVQGNEPFFQSMANGLAGWVFRNGQPVVQTGEDGRVPTLFGNSENLPEFSAVICMPVMVNKSTRGVICLGHSQPHAVDETMRTFLRQAVGHLSLYLENLYLRVRMRELMTKAQVYRDGPRLHDPDASPYQPPHTEQEVSDMFWSKILRFFSEDIAMDLGTANTLLYTRDGGIIVNEPSVVAIDTRNNEVLAVGSEAKRARGRTPKRIKTIRPMKSGVIADFDTTSRMIVYFVNKAIGRSHLVKPSLVISVPTGITGVEKKAVIDAAATAGAGRVSLIEEPMAAAIGADLPVTEPVGTLIADIGGGTSEVAVITMSAITVSQSIRIAGDAMNEILLRMLRDKYRLDVGENTAEHLKILLGSTQPVPDLPDYAEISGRDLVSGVPMTKKVTSEDVRLALKEPVEEIASAVMRVLEKTPPELAADIYTSGFCLAGGSSLLRGLPELLSDRTGLHVFVTEDPLTAVLRGTAKAMQDRKNYKGVFLS